jgi:peptidoglycan/LPS O-acetylase OafA/YrhL
LDGLRGVAAVGVVTFHFMEMVIWNYSKLWIGHGFLAVDFFFCLSGFVIGYAYDDRLEKMGLRTFLKGRLIRLHPLVVLGRDAATSAPPCPAHIPAQLQTDWHRTR